MKTLFLTIAVLLLSSADLGAAPRFVSTPDGEAVSDVELDLTSLPVFTWVTDPFLKAPGRLRAPASATEEEADYKLQATSTEDGDAVAVVNDRVVRVGDKVGRRTVLRIGPDFVALGYRGSVIESFLDESQGNGKTGAKRAPAATGAKDTGTVTIEEIKP